MNPVHVLMHVRENIFYFYLENRILGPPKVDHVTFTTSLNILPIQINLLQLLCFFCGKRELTSAHRTLCFSITATFTKTVSTRFLFSFNIEHKLQLRSQMTQPPAAVNHRLAPWVGWRRTRSTLIQRDPIMIVSAGKCSQSRVILTSIVASTACTMINPEAMSTGPNSREMRTLCFWFPEP